MRPFATLLWFLRMAVLDVPLPYSAIFPVVVTLLAFLFLRQPRDGRRRLLPLFAILPALWLFLGLWGGLFWTQPNHPPRHSVWVGVPSFVVPILFVAAAGYFLWRLRGARFLAALYAAANCYFLLWMWFLSGMAISGDWL